MRIRSIMIGVALLGAVLAAPAGAQEPSPTVDIPDPALCTLKPLTQDDLQRIEDQGFPPIETPTPVALPFQMPAGEELFTSDREEVEKDLRRSIACVNTGEPLKALAAYTDRWIANFLAQQGGFDEELMAGLLVDRDLQPETYLQIHRIGEPVRLADDRVAVLVTGDNPADEAPPSDRLFLLAEVRPGRYLIDEVITIPSE